MKEGISFFSVIMFFLAFSIYATDLMLNYVSFQYEKAASELSSHDPPIVLAKYDANDEANRELSKDYEIQGFPTIKILRDGGKKVQNYNGPREAAGIVSYLKKQVGPASAEIKSKEDATNLIDEKSIFVVSGDTFDILLIFTEVYFQHAIASCCLKSFMFL